MRRRGFTPIELLVVIVIVAILAAILIPAFQRSRDHQKFRKGRVLKIGSVYLKANENRTVLVLDKDRIVDADWNPEAAPKWIRVRIPDKRFDRGYTEWEFDPAGDARFILGLGVREIWLYRMEKGKYVEYSHNVLTLRHRRHEVTIRARHKEESPK